MINLQTALRMQSYKQEAKGLRRSLTVWFQPGHPTELP